MRPSLAVFALMTACAPTAFVRQTSQVEAAGAQECPQGGIAVVRGVDRDRDGRITGDEVDTRDVTCDGVATLSAVVPASEGDCPSGGLVIASGPDTDGDGVLSDGEVVDREAVCNGAQTLSQVADATPAECPGGGVVILVGEDADGDGALSEAEVLSRRPVCDGVAPAASRVQTEPANAAECPDGGVAIVVGEDTDGDGTLTGAEVVSREVVCGGGGGGGDTDAAPTVVFGDVRVGSSLDLASLEGVVRIEGNLTIDCAGAPLADFGALGSLEDVTGDLYVGVCPGLVSLVGFDSLRRVGRDFEIYDVRNITSMSGLSSLEEVGGELYVWFNASLVDLSGLEGLARAGALKVNLNAALRNLDGLSRLSLVEGRVELFDNLSLTSLAGLDGVEVIGGDLAIVQNAVLSDVTALHGLTTVTGADRRVSSNPCLPDAARTAFEAATGLTFSDWSDNGTAIGTPACP